MYFYWPPRKKKPLRLQLIKNAAAQLFFITRRREHITPVLAALHWPAIILRTDFKVHPLIYKALNSLSEKSLQAVKAQVVNVKESIKDAKKEIRHKLCKTLGPNTEIRVLQQLLHQITRVIRTSAVLVLQYKGLEAVNEKAKKGKGRS